MTTPPPRMSGPFHKQPADATSSGSMAAPLAEGRPTEGLPLIVANALCERRCLSRMPEGHRVAAAQPSLIGADGHKNRDGIGGRPANHREKSLRHRKKLY